MTTYTLLTADLQPATTDHQIVRIEHPLLSRPLLVTAHFAPDDLTQPDAGAWAESLTLGGFSWRLPTVEEGFFVPNRSKWPCLDRTIFLGARSDYPAIWTSTPDPEPEDAASYAFVVLLSSGYVHRGHRGGQCHALAVRAGQ